MQYLSNSDSILICFFECGWFTTGTVWRQWQWFEKTDNIEADTVWDSSDLPIAVKDITIEEWSER